jgi:hypothetical protein
MQMLKMQLNTPVEINRDLQIELTNLATGRTVSTKPFLDGSIALHNVDPGEWRVKVKHPNLLFDVFDRNVRVFRDRPTFTPITIPPTLFENAPIRETPEASLAPVQQRLEEATDAAERQADKRAGQPIYADDWNALASVMAGVARTTKEMTLLVSPQGHDHPELVEKMEEIQRNMQRLLEVFGSSIAQLQREIQQLALQRKVDSALDVLPDVTPEVRDRFAGLIAELADARLDTPAIYTTQQRRTAEKIAFEFAALVEAQPAPVRDEPAVIELTNVSHSMAAAPPVATFEAEIRQHNSIGMKSSSGLFLDALTAGRR